MAEEKTKRTEKKKEQRQAEKKEAKDRMANKMRQISIEKVVLSVGATGEELEKGVKLLSMLTGRKPAKMESRKRIPALGVRPKLEVGAVVTIRKGTEEILRRMLATRDDTLKKRQVVDNCFSFGVKEYIEIPGVEYHRDIGIRGLDVTVVFKRTGRRVKLKKAKAGRIPKRNRIDREEIIRFMEEKFGTRFT